MNTPECLASQSACFAQDDLFQIEIKVAQRADQLSEEAGGGRDRDREHWLQAEREVLVLGHTGLI